MDASKHILPQVLSLPNPVQPSAHPPAGARVPAGGEEGWPVVAKVAVPSLTPPPPPWLPLPLERLWHTCSHSSHLHPYAGAVVPSVLMGKQTRGWGSVNFSRHRPCHGVGGARAGRREEGCGLEVFRVTAMCGETAVCPPGTLRISRRRCRQAPYSLRLGSGHLQTHPAVWCQGGARGSPSTEPPALGLTALEWQAPSSSFLP